MTHGARLGQEDEAVAVEAIGDAAAAGAGAFLERRQQPVPHRAIMLALGAVEFLGLERLDDADEIGLMVRALEVAAHPVKGFGDAARDLPRREAAHRAHARDRAGSNGAVDSSLSTQESLLVQPKPNSPTASVRE